MVEAARKHNRVVQVGMQNRSSPYARSAQEHIRSGKLGSVHLVRVFNMLSRERLLESSGHPGSGRIRLGHVSGSSFRPSL